READGGSDGRAGRRRTGMRAGLLHLRRGRRLRWRIAARDHDSADGDGDTAVEQSLHASLPPWMRCGPPCGGPFICQCTNRGLGGGSSISSTTGARTVESPPPGTVYASAAPKFTWYPRSISDPIVIALSGSPQ